MLVNILSTESELRHFIQRPNGFMFKYKKINNQYIHTDCEGELLEKIGLTTWMITNKTPDDFLTFEEAKVRLPFYEKAWNGEYINYEGFRNGVYYLVFLIPIKQDNKVVEVMGTTFDITRERINERFNKQAEKLAMVGQLAAGIAHEIRNPLTSLKGFTQILKEHTTEKNQLGYLEIMLGELNRIEQIVNEFMLLSKPHDSLNIKETNIQTLIQSVIKFLTPETALHNVKINSDFRSEIIASCDENQIKQVLLNLLQNAFDASPEKSEIVILLEVLNRDYFQITIKDYGYGISEERQKNLFEPFFTTKEKGTGLGLMTCKRIIELHHGKISISSKENMGTIVEIMLPFHVDMK